jgi:hypothetical protein
LINEAKRIQRRHVSVERFEGTGVKELLNTSARGNAHVMVALGADHQVGFKALAEDGLFAFGALRPQTVRNGFLGDNWGLCPRGFWHSELL